MVESSKIIDGRVGYVKKVSLFKKNILYYMGMGEEQNNSGEAGFEESLKQILSNDPPGGHGTAAGKPPTRPHTEDTAQKAADRAETERKALFWINLIRPLALLAFLALLAMFVLRITAER
jgi:hypothetical protein